MKNEMRLFGDYILDPASGALWRKGIAVQPLIGQQLVLLLLLINRYGNDVTYSQIRREVKGKSKRLKDEYIRKLVSNLRDVLGDDPAAPRYIKTARGVGFTFLIRAVSCASPDQEETGTLVDREPSSCLGVDLEPRRQDSKDLAQQSALIPPDPALPSSNPEVPPALPAAPVYVTHATRAGVSGGVSGRLRIFRLPVWTTLVTALVLAVSLTFWYRQRTRSFAPPIQTTSIVVLPIKNITGDSANEYLAEGLTNAITSALEVMAGSHVRVIAFSTAMTYKQKAQRVNEIGSELKVDYVLEGSMLRQGEGLRVNMDLRRTKDEGQVTSGVFDVDQKNVPVAAAVFASNVLTALPLNLPHFDTVATYISPSREAREAYVRGEHYLWLRTHEGLVYALLEFKNATEADHFYAQAFSQLATTYFLLGGRGWMVQKQSAEMGRQAFETALKLNAKDADAHAAKGYYCWFYRWDWVEGERELRRAIEFNPSDVNALEWYALAMTSEGRAEEGREWMRRALEVDPKSEILQTNLGWIEYFGGNTERAAELLERVLREDPGFTNARVKLLSVYSLLDRKEDAYRQLRFITLEALSTEEQSSLDAVYKAHGYAEASRSWANDQKSTAFGYTLVNAETAALSGDQESAVQTLLHWQSTHDGWMVFAAVDPALQRLKADVRLKTLFLELQRSRTEHS